MLPVIQNNDFPSHVLLIVSISKLFVSCPSKIPTQEQQNDLYVSAFTEPNAQVYNMKYRLYKEQNIKIKHMLH